MVQIAQSVTVSLVSLAGGDTVHVSNIHDFTERAVSAATEDSRVLRYFDPYGSLALNSIQMPDFLADWDDAKVLVASELDQRTWDEVRALALRVQASNTDVLRIDGD